MTSLEVYISFITVLLASETSISLCFRRTEATVGGWGEALGAFVVI